MRGLYLEGAGWDKKNSCLVEAEPMQMSCPIPTIHFKPVENRKKMGKSELFGTITLTVFPSSSPCFVFRPVVPLSDLGSSVSCPCECSYVPVSVLLLPRAFGRRWTSIFCDRREAQIRSCYPRPLDQERDRSSHESGQLNAYTPTHSTLCFLLFNTFYTY